MKKWLLAACLLSQGAFAVAEHKEFAADGLKEVSVENTTGKVTISSLVGAKAVVASTKNHFSDQCEMLVERSGHSLVVKVEKRSGLFSGEECDVDLALKVPKAVALKVAVGSGNLTVVGMQGALTFQTGSGDVSADGSFPRMEGKSGSGNVAVKGLAGAGKMRTGSGSISLQFATIPKQGEFELETGNGDATLLFPKGAHVRTNFRTGSGQLSNQLGEDPNASFLISMRSGSGDLKVNSYSAEKVSK